MRTVERLFRRAEIAVRETEGFHPKPRFHYPASLALGMSGLDEVLEADLADSCEPATLLNRLNAHSVVGLEFVAADVLPSSAKKGQPQSLEFAVVLPPTRFHELAGRVEQLLAADTWFVERDGKPIDIRPLVLRLALDGGKLIMQLRVVQEAGARPRDVLEALGSTAEEILELETTRTRVEMST